jgi:hypothetical protein
VLAVAVESDAVQLHPVIDEAEAELLGNPPLQGLQLLVDEFDDVAGFDVDQMVVMGVGSGLVAGAAVAELMPFKDSCFLEQSLTVRYTVAMEIFGSTAEARS